MSPEGGSNPAGFRFKPRAVHRNSALGRSGFAPRRQRGAAARTFRENPNQHPRHALQARCSTGRRAGHARGTLCGTLVEAVLFVFKRAQRGRPI